MNKKFYNLLNQEKPDLKEIINLVQYGKRGWLQKNKTIGLFETVGKNKDTVFILLAKQDTLLDILTAVFDNVLSIVERETGELVDIGNDKDIASFLVVRFCLKNNKEGNNALFYSIQREKYDVLDKIVKFYPEKTNCNALDKVKKYHFSGEFQEYLGKIDTVELVEIVSTSITKGYTDLSNFFFEFLRCSEQHYKIPKLIESFKQQEINLDKGIEKQLIQLCHHSYNYILDNVSIKEDEKQNLATLIHNSSKYEKQFKNLVPASDVSLGEYTLNCLCKAYLNNVEDFEIANIKHLFVLLDENDNIDLNAQNIMETKGEKFIPMNNTNRNTNENNASSSNDSGTSSVSKILFSAIILAGVALLLTKFFQKMGDSDNDDAQQNKPIEPRSLNSNNLEEFLKKLVLKTEYSLEEKAIFYKKAANRAKDIDYTDQEKEKCKLIFEEAYRIQREKINICQHHKAIIKTMAQRMSISLDSDSVSSDTVISNKRSNSVSSDTLNSSVLPILNENKETELAGENDLNEAYE